MVLGALEKIFVVVPEDETGFICFISFSNFDQSRSTIQNLGLVFRGQGLWIGLNLSRCFHGDIL